jgi:aspartyl-tRNA(Asn)/glutamyl-tRNA(Gln) amidotransferase subunit B
MVESGRSPREIVDRKGLEQLTDESQIRAVVERVVAEHPDEVQTYREGKAGLAGFFIGQVMRETRGRANPRLVRELVGMALAGDELAQEDGER